MNVLMVLLWNDFDALSTLLVVEMNAGWWLRQETCAEEPGAAEPSIRCHNSFVISTSAMQHERNENDYVERKKQMPVEYAPCFGGLGCHVTQQTGKITFTLQHRFETKLAAEKNTTFDIKSVNFSLTALVLARYMLNLVHVCAFAHLPFFVSFN